MGRRHALTYPVTKEWKLKVIAELERRGRGSATWLAREIGCSTSTLSELLHNDESKQSHLVPAIHAAFGWPPPLKPLDSTTLPAILDLFERLDDTDRDTVRQLAQSLLDAALKRKKTVKT